MPKQKKRTKTEELCLSDATINNLASDIEKLNDVTNIEDALKLHAVTKEKIQTLLTSIASLMEQLDQIDAAEQPPANLMQVDILVLLKEIETDIQCLNSETDVKQRVALYSNLINKIATGKYILANRELKVKQCVEPPI